MARRERKQRVALRDKRRRAIQHHLQHVLIRGGVVVFIGGFLAGAVVHGDPFISRFIQRHTPIVTIGVSPEMVRAPAVQDVPLRPIFLWLPGAESWVRRYWARDYPDMAQVHFQKDLLNNAIRIQLVARTPVLRWNENTGMDCEGVLFPMKAGAWGNLPKAFVSGSMDDSRRALAHWIDAVSRRGDFWSQVVSLTKDSRGDVGFQMQTGTQVLWGAPELRGVPEKSRYLRWVLEDAHQHLGGAALADLRFFDEGRIIVRPKGSV